MDYETIRAITAGGVTAVIASVAAIKLWVRSVEAKQEKLTAQVEGLLNTRCPDHNGRIAMLEAGARSMNDALVRIADGQESIHNRLTEMSRELGRVVGLIAGSHKS